MPLVKLSHRRKHKVRLIKGGSVLNTILNNGNILPELHLLDGTKKYNFCGPFTKLDKRIILNSDGSIKEITTQPINPLDNACMYHDIAYEQNKDVVNRNLADLSLLRKANDFYDQSNNIIDKLNGGIVSKAMQTKIKYNI